MSGGGGSQTTVTKNDPWAPAQPALTDVLNRARQVANTPASYYPGQLTVGPTQAEANNWNTQGAYNTNVFGTTPSLNFGDTAGGYSGLLQGGAYSDLLPGIQDQAVSALNSGLSQGAPQIGRYNYDASINPSGSAPQFGTAGNLDATGYYRNALSGQPDYAGVQGAIDAANAPILRNFQNDILPQLNSRATFLNNGTGGIKTLNAVLPEIGQRMGENAQSITNNERLRALDAQQSAAQQIAQGGLGAYGLGLSTDQARVNAGAGQAGFNLGNDQAVANAANDYRSSVLGYGGLLGQYAGGANSATGNALGQAGNVFGLQSQPLQTNQNLANWDRTLQEQQLAAQQQRFNYLRDYPQNQVGWYGNLASQIAGQGGSGTSSTSQSAPGLGWGDALTGGLGLLSIFSDRRLKTDITRIGTLDSGLAIYRYRYKGLPTFHIGVMADEARERFPTAVATHESGFDTVDYSQVA